MDRFAHPDRCLLADPVDLQRERGFAVVALGAKAVGKAFLDGCDVAQPDDAAVVGVEQWNLRVFVSPIPAVRDADQKLARAGLELATRTFHRRLPNLLRDAIEREPEAAEFVLIDLDMDLEALGALQIDLGDPRVGEQAVAHLLGSDAQRPLVDVTVDEQVEHLPATRDILDLGSLGFVAIDRPPPAPAAT